MRASNKSSDCHKVLLKVIPFQKKKNNNNTSTIRIICCFRVTQPDRRAKYTGRSCLRTEIRKRGNTDGNTSVWTNVVRGPKAEKTLPVHRNQKQTTSNKLKWLWPIHSFWPVQNNSLGRRYLGVAVLASLGSGHLHDLAGTSLQYHVAVLAQSGALHGVGGRGARLASREVKIGICHGAMEQGRCQRDTQSTFTTMVLVKLRLIFFFPQLRILDASFYNLHEQV